MGDLNTAKGWLDLGRWLWNHGLVALMVLAAYVMMSSNGWLDPSVRFATASEVVVIQKQIAAQSERYDQINKSLLEIQIGQAQASLREMQRDADARRQSGQSVPTWLDEQIRDMARKLEKLKVQADQ